jgi:hypothetical protein
MLQFFMVVAPVAVAIAAFIAGHRTYLRNEWVRKFVLSLPGFALVHGGFLAGVVAWGACFVYGWMFLAAITLGIAGYLSAISWSADGFEHVPTP